MPTPNYGYEKRQKELAKKKKKEEKLREKQHRKLEISSPGLNPGDPDSNVAAEERDPPTVPTNETKNA